MAMSGYDNGASAIFPLVTGLRREQLREGYDEISWLALTPDRPSSGLVTANSLACSHDTCRVTEHQIMSGEMRTLLRTNSITFTPTSSKSTSSSDESESFCSPSFSEVVRFSGDVMTRLWRSSGDPPEMLRAEVRSLGGSGVWGQEGVNGYGSSRRKRHAQNIPPVHSSPTISLGLLSDLRSCGVVTV